MRYAVILFVLPFVVGIPYEAIAGETNMLDQVKNAIGILELPKLFGFRDPNAPPGSMLSFPSKRIKLFSQPDKNALVLTSINETEELKIVEFSYEENGVVVYQEYNGWYLIGRSRGAPSGWVAPEDSGTFHSIEELLMNGLAYLTKYWDGRIRDEPGISHQGKMVNNSNMVFEKDVRVVLAKRVENHLWFRVDILAPGRCYGKEIKSITSGWIPAYSESGHLTVWFSPRGC